jgi:hypothetical protein
MLLNPSNLYVGLCLCFYREIFQSLDMRTQGRLVKFPRSTVRFSQRLSTFKELLYISDGDCNGVFYYLGTSFGQHPWMNPVLTKVYLGIIDESLVLQEAVFTFIYDYHVQLHRTVTYELHITL